MKEYMLLILSVLLVGCSDVNYRSGRDTVKGFGDGRFQVLRTRRKATVLYDLQQQKTIAHDVGDWTVLTDHVCTFDRTKQVFIVLDLKSGHFEQYKDASLAPVGFRLALQGVGENGESGPSLANRQFKKRASD